MTQTNNTKEMSTHNTYVTPTLRTRVNVYPLGSDEPWLAEIVGFTSDGRIRVRAVREDGGLGEHLQTISRDGRTELA